MGSEPSGPYRVETFTMDDMEYASVVGPNGFSESWATAADRAHEAARLMNIACASGDEAGYERGVREEREAWLAEAQKWLDAYPLDLWPEPPKHTGLEDATIREQVAAAMGRHVGKLMVAFVRARTAQPKPKGGG